MKKKCPRCKCQKNQTEWADGGWTNTTYCKECQKYYNKVKRNKADEKIMKATRNGQCWWLLQSIYGDRHFRKEE